MGGSPFDFNSGLWSSKPDPRPIFYHIPPKLGQSSRPTQVPSNFKGPPNTPARYSIRKPNPPVRRRKPLPERSKLAPIIIDSDSDSDVLDPKPIKKAKREGSKFAPIQINSDSDNDISDWSLIYGEEEDQNKSKTPVIDVLENEVEEDDDDFDFITEGVCTEEAPAVDHIGE
jgi:hypothetical protein